VIKDGLKLDDCYTKLIDRVSTDIVSKSKCCSSVADELRVFNKKLNKKNLTRWNSTLFMIRSVLKLTPVEFALIRNKLPSKTEKQKQTKKNFNLTAIERKMLEELKQVLEMFEFVSDELQADGVTISKVYPCIDFLKKKLILHLDMCEYSKQIREELLISLNDRFKNCDQNETYVVASFLDSTFGLDVFEDNKKEMIKNKIKNLLEIERLKNEAKILTSNNKEQSNLKKKDHDIVIKRNNNFIFYRKEESIENDDLESSIDEYIRAIKSTGFTCTLIFWKNNHLKFPELANLAKKYLGVPASSASAERMFSISGHIFSSKRRRMGAKIFSELVYLKLNDDKF
jgi:hypothetical protein